MVTYLEHRVQRAIHDLVEARANYAAQAYADRDRVHPPYPSVGLGVIEDEETEEIP